MARTADETREAKRLFMAKKRAADPVSANAYNMEYHYRNHEKNKAKMRDYYGKRFFWGRAMKLRGEGKATTFDLASIWRKQKGLCVLTGRKLDRTAQLDHILPKARGGTDYKQNLRWICEEANIAKRHMTDEEFFTLCKSVMRWIGERIEAVDSIL